MNYRHGYHAGNFADVVKHLAEIAVLAHLAKKDAPFAVIDSHAGRGLYDLRAEQARKTGEAEAGIGRLQGLSGPSLLESYLALVAESGWGSYPGSPLIAAKMLRPQDRLAAIEKHPEEAAALKQVLAPWRKARVEEGDGYARLLALLPPAERRGLVLIDPPFEAPDEFQTAARTVREAYRKFATGIYLIWYPIKSDAAGNAFVGEVLASGAAKVLRIEIAIAAPDDKLGRAGVLLLNPPYQFEQEMRAALDVVAPKLEAKTRIDWLAGGT
ncbi:MAG TPA: 23S rRNA (adenine(2030)-N(6))-methyltransferase RlmJ [Rhizomicrobium sp.]|jgi:23S rRNA (adenine2030-N6)-methyltransferase|nr:23S rRNA (adenine(2030)-N(6))-methyltransferase RlmJ [Rhizomicrobium sp.]